MLRWCTPPFVQAQLIKENIIAPRHLSLCKGIHRWSVNSSHKGPATRKMFPFHDVIMFFPLRFLTWNDPGPILLTSSLSEIRAWRKNYIPWYSAGCKLLIHAPNVTLPWRHNRLDSVSNHQPHHCLLSRLFGRRSKKTSKLRVTGLCAWNSPGTGEFPAQRASYAENVSIWWRHHDGC